MDCPICTMEMEFVEEMDHGTYVSGYWYCPGCGETVDEDNYPTG